MKVTYLNKPFALDHIIYNNKNILANIVINNIIYIYHVLEIKLENNKYLIMIKDNNDYKDDNIYLDINDISIRTNAPVIDKIIFKDIKAEYSFYNNYIEIRKKV
jgi:hypothetical protein